MVRTVKLLNFFYQCRVRVTNGPGTKLMPDKNRLGANMSYTMPSTV
jgi:hypothetical protein